MTGILVDIEITDQRSLMDQIGKLVKMGMDQRKVELIQRREALKKLLDQEEEAYERDFKIKMQVQMNEELNERKNFLLKKREVAILREKDFLQKKLIQQRMENCIEIREALRQKKLRDVKACQAEQIVEKERQIAQEKRLDLYWQQVQKVQNKVLDERFQTETAIKHKIRQENQNALKAQMQEHECERLRRRQEFDEQRRKKTAVNAELDKLEEKTISQKNLDYAKGLLQEINAKVAQRKLAREQLAEEHRKLICEVQRTEALNKDLALQRKLAVKESTLSYLKYVKKVKDMKVKWSDWNNYHISEIERIDNCTKYNRGAEAQRRLQETVKYYAELKRQACEQYEKRLREEHDHKWQEFVNHFARPLRSREEILQERWRMRAELDKQVAELNRIKQMEKDKYEEELQRALVDPEFCTRLAEEYIQNGIDYLQPHANWRIVHCPEITTYDKELQPFPLDEAYTTQRCGCFSHLKPSVTPAKACKRCS